MIKFCRGYVDIICSRIYKVYQFMTEIDYKDLFRTPPNHFRLFRSNSYTMNFFHTAIFAYRKKCIPNDHSRTSTHFPNEYSIYSERVFDLERTFNLERVLDLRRTVVLRTSILSARKKPLSAPIKKTFRFLVVGLSKSSWLFR